MRVKLTDIADKVGLSVNTISRALRDMPDISEETKKSVREIAESMGYFPNMAASMLRTNKSEALGVIMPDISNPVFSGMIKGIESAAKEKGYTIILNNTNENYEEEEKAIKSMLQRAVDGILLVPTMIGKGTINELLNKNVPFVLLGRNFSDIHTNIVLNDDVFGGYLAGKHLISCGHKEFLFITGPLFISSAKDRLDGFRRAVTESGISLKAINVYEAQASMQGAYELAHTLLEKGVSFTAVFCFSDFMAFGVLKALKEKGISIPDEAAVMGYDDIEFSEIFTPSLTTIDMSKYRLGKRATDLLIQEINTPIAERTKKQIIMEPRLVVRKSTC